MISSVFCHLSSVELSRYAIDLEKRSIQLSIKEGSSINLRQNFNFQWESLIFSIPYCVTKGKHLTDGSISSYAWNFVSFFPLWYISMGMHFYFYMHVCVEVKSA